MRRDHSWQAAANANTWPERLHHRGRSCAGSVRVHGRRADHRQGSRTDRRLVAPTDDHHPDPERVRWAEALRLSLDLRDGKYWLIVDPEIWIWPSRARRVADEFMDRRRGDRFNKKYNQLLGVWVRLIVGTDARNTEVTLSAFASGSAAENPSFSFGTRTGFSQRLVS